MFPHAERFEKWLRRRSPHATTPIHYTNDLKLFFAWAGKPPEAITLHDVDAYIHHCRRLGHAVATINRRLAAIRTFYHFLRAESGDARPNPVLPRRHVIRQGAACREAATPLHARLPGGLPAADGDRHQPHEQRPGHHLERRDLGHFWPGD